MEKDDDTARYFLEMIKESARKNNPLLRNAVMKQLRGRE
jgi:hypothetical protein